jgi:hypothetical protein
MGKPGIAKVQHYVPQFLLKNFGNGKKDQIHVFDKNTSRTFLTNAKNVASESRFYDFNIDGKETTLEPVLTKIESAAKPIFQRLLEADCIATLSDLDKGSLSTFLAVQFTRTKSFREQFRSIPELLLAKLRKKANNEADLEAIKDYITVPDENETKIETARMIINAPKDYGPQFINKRWVLIATEKRTPFIINDNPITLQNMIDMQPYGNLGLAVLGIEIYFPLSPTRALLLLCPSHEETMKQELNKLPNAHAVPLHLRHEFIRTRNSIQNILKAFETGSPLQYDSKNVENFNALQIANAERYIFSSNEDFAHADLMIRANPKLRNGRRMNFA